MIPRGDHVFLIRIPLGQRGGVRKFQTETYHGSAEDAEKRCTELLSQVDNGTFFRPSAKPVGVFLEEWLEQKRREGARKITSQTYRSIVEL